jgi:ABC-type antimicrobial peptide transport system permease subunit
VVGVVGDIKDDGIDKEPPKTVYWPIVLDQFLGQEVMVKRGVAYVVRSSSRAGTGSLLEDLQRAVWAVSNELPLADVRTLGEIYDQSMARASFTLVMLAIAGGMALLLGVVGIYAVMSSAVSQRMRELGIRIALGATHVQVIALVLRHSLALTVLGVVVGLAGAAALTRFLKGVLFGVTPLDPVTFLCVSVMLTFVATLAAHIPARRAGHVDPMTALKAE